MYPIYYMNFTRPPGCIEETKSRARPKLIPREGYPRSNIKIAHPAVVNDNDFFGSKWKSYIIHTILPATG